MARDGAAAAAARGSAIVAVGGDGTINAVAQAAQAQGCPIGQPPAIAAAHSARRGRAQCHHAHAVLRQQPAAGRAGGLREAPSLDAGRIAAVMLRPIGALAMRGLMWRGAMGTLGEADPVESFDFQHMAVESRLALHRRGIKVAVDGEVGWMRPPIVFRVADRPLYLLKPQAAVGSGGGAVAGA